jgi:hypothetical protein
MNLENAKNIVAEYEKIAYKYARSGYGFIPIGELTNPVDIIKNAIKRVFFSEYIDRKNFTQQRGNHFILLYGRLASFISEEQCILANPIIFDTKLPKCTEDELHEAYNINERVTEQSRKLADEFNVVAQLLSYNPRPKESTSQIKLQSKEQVYLSLTQDNVTISRMGGFMGLFPKGVIWECHDLVRLIKLIADEDDPHNNIFDATLFKVLYCKNIDEIIQILS